MVLRSSKALPLLLTVGKDGVGGVGGLTCAVTVREGLESGRFLDFADMVIKADGWVEKQAWLEEIDHGTYAVLLDVSVIQGLSSPTWLVASYEVITPGYLATTSEVIQVEKDPEPVAQPKQDSAPKRVPRRRVL